MILEIDQEILQKTTNCEKNFSCLSNKNHIPCKVKSIINNKVIFVECLNRDYCKYIQNYGNSYICLCPTRIEIFKKYGI